MSIPLHVKQKLQSRRLPAALLISGDGRESLALELAAGYLCTADTPPCGSCRHCRKVAAGIHPDLIIASDLKVDPIRALRADAYIRPNEAERKVYLLQDADSMNQSAQNALLKLLEEGPLYAAFFFLVHNPERLLPTLRSRCEQIRSEDGENTALTEEVEAFLTLLTANGDKHGPLLRFLIGLEKKPREEWPLFLDCSIEGLVARLPQNPTTLMPKLDVLREVRGACDFTIGVGHVCGWLMAELC